MAEAGVEAEVGGEAGEETEETEEVEVAGGEAEGEGVQILLL